MKKTFEVELEIPAEQAWHVLAEQFADTGKWTTVLHHSYNEGDAVAGLNCTRVCVKGDQELRETIVEWDAAKMVFAYDAISGLPAPMNSGINRWQITPRGSHRSMASSTSNVVLKWWARPLAPVMSFGMNVAMGRVLEEFKHWAELGRPHPRKQAQVDKLAKKTTHAGAQT